MNSAKQVHSVLIAQLRLEFVFFLNVELPGLAQALACVRDLCLS